jgi:hypothetical protein
VLHLQERILANGLTDPTSASLERTDAKLGDRRRGAQTLRHVDDLELYICRYCEETSGAMSRYGRSKNAVKETVTAKPLRRQHRRHC